MGESNCRGNGRDLVLVTAGLELDGGGRAVVGRLLAAAAARYADSRGIGFEVLSLGRSNPLGDGLPFTPFAGSQPALALAVWRRQLRAAPPAFLFDLLGPARAQAWVPPRRRAPYLLVMLGIEVWRPLSRSRARALAGATVRLAISAHTLARARPFLPAAAGDAQVLHLALEDRRPDGEVDPEVLQRAGSGYLLIVGRMATSEGYKGHAEVLAALGELHQGRCPARLVVVGGGDDRPRLEALAAARGLGEAVLFTGFVSEATLAELYRRAAVFVMPSRGEGFGLVYLEAMRQGVPCVAAEGTVAAEIIEDGRTGHLVAADDPTQLAGVLGHLLAQPEAARRLGEAGRRRWRREFSLERFQRGLEGHLDRLTGARPAPDGGAT